MAAGIPNGTPMHRPSARAAACLVLLAAALPQARRSAAATTCSQDQGLSFSAAAPRLGQVLTHLTVGTLASFGTSTGPSFYTVSVENRTSAPIVFRLAVEFKFIPSDPSLAASCADRFPDGGEGCWIQRQSTYDITVGAGQTWVKTSNQVARLTTGGIPGDDNPFRTLLNRVGDIPAGKAVLMLGLVCPGSDPMGSANAGIPLVPGTAWWTENGTYQPARVPQPVSPGGPSGQGFPVVVANPPIFVFTGNLDRANTGATAPYRLLVWDFPDGATLDQVQATIPVRNAPVRRGVVPWPSGWHPLEAGKKYVWRVDALLRGVADDWLPSPTWAFSVPSPASPAAGSDVPAAVAGGAIAPVVHGTPEQDELVQLLALLAGPHRAAVEGELRAKLPDPATLTIGGRPATVEQLRALVQDVLAGRTSVDAAGVAP